MTMITGRQALMELLRNEGVEYVFGIPGATEILFMDTLEKYPEMKYILGLHEVVIAGMDLDDPIIDFCQLAEAMGVRGDRVEQPDDLRATLEAAFDAEEPRLVEVSVENKDTP
ncbi:thiamine pyrophosphate-binding protein [Chloroflexota bacterium]